MYKRFPMSLRVWSQECVRTRVGENTGVGEDGCASLSIGVHLGVSCALRKGEEGMEVSAYRCVRCECGAPSVRMGVGCETLVCPGDPRVP